MALTYKLAVAAGLTLFAVTAVTVSQIGLSHAEDDAAAMVSQEEQALLKEVMPEADAFSVKQGSKPHHKAYAVDPDTGEQALIGFVFMTNEVEPEEWAYSSEIEALVGLRLDGVITKVKLIDHYEPFGYFSIDPPEFVEQFEGKSIMDPFEEGRDIDTVTRATITIEGAARVIRKSARQIARQYLAEQKASR